MVTTSLTWLDHGLVGELRSLCRLSLQGVTSWDGIQCLGPSKVWVGAKVEEMGSDIGPWVKPFVSLGSI